MNMKTPTGKTFATQETNKVTGAWLELPGKPHRSLSVQETKFGSNAMTYAGYRDGICLAEKMAISYMADDTIQIHLILSGNEPETQRTRTFTLEQLEALIRATDAFGIKPY